MPLDYRRAFFYLTHDLICCCRFSHDPWLSARIEYLRQSAKANAGMNAHIPFPDNGHFPVGVMLRDFSFHDAIAFKVIKTCRDGLVPQVLCEETRY